MYFRLRAPLAIVLTLLVASVLASSAAAGKGKPKPVASNKSGNSSTTVTITDPQGGFATNASSLPVDVAFTGASAKDSIDLRVDGVDAGSWQVPSRTSSGTQSFTVDLSSRAEGTLTLAAVISDGRHSTTSTTVSGILDRTPPAIASDAPAGWGKAPLTVHLTAADPGGSGVAKTCWTVDGGSEGCTGSAAADAVLTAGTHELGYRAFDRAGNAGAEQTATVKVDGTAPATTDNAPAGWVHGPVTVTLDANDVDSGVATTCYALDGSPGCGTSILVVGDGQHTLTYNSTDAAGNVETSHTAVVKIDDTTPVTASVVPPGFVGAPSTVQLTATDAASGVAKTCWSIDSGTQVCNQASGVVSALATTVTIPAGTSDGTHTLTYQSVDGAGNSEAAESAELHVDATAPTTAALADPPVNGQNGWYDPGPVTVALAASDGTSGVAQLCYQLDGGAATCSATTAATVTVDADGAHVLTYHAVDNAGNSESDQTVDVNIDTTVPKITPVLTPATPQISGQDWFSSLTVHFNCSDATSGVAFCTSDKTLPDGANQSASGLATDKAGNAASTTLDGIDVDGTAPTIDARVVNDAGEPAAITGLWYTEPVTVEFTCADALSGVLSCPAGTSLGDGEQQNVRGTATDRAGNTRTDTVTVNVDTVAPTISGTLTPSAPNGSNGWYTSPVTVTWACADAGSGIAACTATQTLADGANQRPAGLATDNAGHATPLELAPIDVDTTAPTTTPDTGSGPHPGSSITVTLKATDATSGIAMTCYAVDGGARTCQSIDPAANELDARVSVPGVGAHTVDYYSVDEAGNIEAQQTLSLLLDDTAPTTSDDLTASGWIPGTSTTLTLTATDAGAGVAQTCYRVDSGSTTCAAPGSPAPSFEVPVLVSGNGAHVVRYFSRDAAGNTEATHTVGLGLDGAAPTTELVNPASNWTTGPVTVTFAASDPDSGVAQTCYTLGAAPEVCGDPQVSFATNEEGDQTLTYYSVDVAGNTESAHSAHVKIDNTAPTISIDANWEQGLELLHVNCTVGDSLSGVDMSTLDGQGDDYQIPLGSCLWTFPALPGFEHDVTYTVSDVAGNQTTVEARLFENGDALGCEPLQGTDACGTLTTTP